MLHGLNCMHNLLDTHRKLSQDVNYINQGFPCGFPTLYESQ